jgi:hypothetical protein
MKLHDEIDMKTKENGEIISNHESTPALSIDKKSPDVIVPSPANGELGPNLLDSPVATMSANVVHGSVTCIERSYR